MAQKVIIERGGKYLNRAGRWGAAAGAQPFGSEKVARKHVADRKLLGDFTYPPYTKPVARRPAPAGAARAVAKKTAGAGA